LNSEVINNDDGVEVVNSRRLKEMEMKAMIPQDMIEEMKQEQHNVLNVDAKVEELKDPEEQGKAKGKNHKRKIVDKKTWRNYTKGSPKIKMEKASGVRSQS